MLVITPCKVLSRSYLQDKFFNSKIGVRSTKKTTSKQDVTCALIAETTSARSMDFGDLAGTASGIHTSRGNQAFWTRLNPSLSMEQS